MKKNKYVFIIIITLILLSAKYYSSICNYIFILSNRGLLEITILKANPNPNKNDTLFNNKNVILSIKKRDNKSIIILKNDDKLKYLFLLKENSTIVYKHLDIKKSDNSDLSIYLSINFFTEMAVDKMKNVIINWDTLESQINKKGCMLKIFGINDNKKQLEFLGIYGSNNEEILYFRFNLGRLKTESYVPYKKLNNITLMKYKNNKYN